MRFLPFSLNIPNTITAVRLVMTPVMVLLLLDRAFLSALLVFVFAAATDGLDGLLARALKQQTALGSYLDPLADKAMLCSAYIVLAAMEEIPAWVTVVVISRDVLIIIGAAIVTLFKGTFMARPTIVSKLTTVLQILTVFAVLLDKSVPIPAGALEATFWGVTALTTASGLHYVFVGLHILSDNSGDTSGMR